MRVADRRVRFPAVEALAKAHVAPCAAGVRQSRDCLRPRSPRRPRPLASAAPLSSGNRPHFHGIRRGFACRALVPVAVARLRLDARRLACACGADAARCCRLAPPRPRIRRAMRPASASARLAGPRARPALPLNAPHICNRNVSVIAMYQRNHGVNENIARNSLNLWRQEPTLNIYYAQDSHSGTTLHPDREMGTARIRMRILCVIVSIHGGKNQRWNLLRAGFSSRRCGRVDAAVLRLHCKGEARQVICPAARPR